MTAKRAVATTVTTAVLAGVISLALPAISYAASHAERFDPGNIDPQTRLPADPDQDWHMPDMTNPPLGEVEGNAAGCPSEVAGFHFRLMRDRTAFPDQKIVEVNNIDYCDSALEGHRDGIAWNSGEFHFDVTPEYIPQPSTDGRVEAYW